MPCIEIRRPASQRRVPLCRTGLLLQSPLPFRDSYTVPAGIHLIDEATGGLPRGGLTELCGPPSSGKTRYLQSAWLRRTESAEGAR